MGIRLKLSTIQVLKDRQVLIKAAFQLRRPVKQLNRTGIISMKNQKKMT